MKLGFIFDVCFTRYNGHYYSTNLTNSLWKDRYLCHFDEIVVVGRVQDIDTDPTGKLVQSDSEHVSFKCIDNVKGAKRILNYISETRYIEKVIADCDFVICRGWWGVQQCRKLQKNYVIEVISCVWDALTNHSILGKIMSIPYYILQRKAIYQSPNVIYVTSEFLQKRYPTKGNHIGVSDVIISHDLSEEVMNKRLEHINIKKDKIILGTAAAVNVAYKGQKYVIKALAQLKAKGCVNYEYHMAGNGDPQNLINYATKFGVENQIKFLGAIPHDKILNWYDSIDLYIQPSNQEGLPRALVEAMSRALPCIGSNAGGIPELLDKKCIFKKKNINQICKMLECLTNDDMIKYSEQNFNKAKLYEKSKLDNKRNKFYKEFITGNDSK